jgi:acyl-CoA synthetase (AMP-forming)/AMP-acid ligase II
VFEHWLFARLAGWESRTALVWRDRPYTFRALADGAANWLRRLAELRIGPGNVVAVVGDFSPSTCSLFLALFASESIIVPLRPASYQSSQLDVAGTDAVIDVATGRVHRRGPRGSHPLLDRLRADRRAGLVLFSSGSTGTPKASLLDLARLLERHRQPRPARTTLAFLQWDHIGGLNTLLYTLSSGSTAVFCEERHTDAICRTIHQHAVQLLPTTPTFLRMLLISEAHRRFDLSSLEVISYGTEPMPSATLSALRAAFPDVALKQTYGLTELGILPTQSSGDSLWLKIGGPGFETKVVDGILLVRSVTAMLGYLNAPSPFDADGWFNTQDAVEVQGDRVKILGRASELINVGAEKVYPAEVENVLLEAANVRAAVVFGRANPVTGQVVAARVTLTMPEEPAAVRKRLQSFCRERLAAFQVPAVVELAEQEVQSERFKSVRTTT